ncbi:heterokaryon incompatibility protein-domain-containing protein [Cladorrhinum samala]|uniref:Heterokaryon incompatibility protein-domain-containing protein n=1 Tax=Cladorrhinum samala TaxID=585594 RepID=A0AAV9HFV0_9PEZI|nr:heterokaryon incompatibility protein-domain-containing protein [Cladorrhinum samala]
MASSVLCNSCVLQTQELAAITQQLRANTLAHQQLRESNDTKVVAGANQAPPPPPPWPARRYLTSSLKQLKADCRLSFPNEASDCDLEVFSFVFHWRLANTEVEDFEDMCIGTKTYTHTGSTSRLLLAMSDSVTKLRFGRLRKIKEFIERQSGRPEIQGLKLIDCERRVVVKAPVGIKWVTLSYVWSLAAPRHCPLDAELRTSWEPESERDIIRAMPTSLPGIISDAMDATLALGYRYLWADQFCIDQSNKEEVAKQVGKMDQIYRGADLTIVAASARNGLPGTRALPREEPKSVLVAGVEFFIPQIDPVGDIAGSAWSTRGWCYQEEILSRRLLYFTEAGVLFKCPGMTCYEQIGGPELVVNQQDVEAKSRVHQVPLEDTEILYGPSQMDPKSSFDRSLAGSEGVWDHSTPQGTFNLMAVRAIIAGFTKRRLSFDVDSLNAVIGVLTVFEGVSPPVYCCQGLPVSQNLRGQFEDSLFLQSLYWYHTDPASAQRRAQFPSWSWAGWNGSIGWIRLARGGFELPGIFSLPHWDGLNLKHDARVLALAGGCDYSPRCDTSTVTGFDKGTTHDCRVQAGCSVANCKFILLDSRAVPASFFSFRQPPANRQANAGTCWEDLVMLADTAHPTYHHPESVGELFLAGGYELSLLKYTEFLSCDEFVDRVRRGQLECILLGEHIPEIGATVVCIHLLVVEWISPTAAQRFCFLTFVLYYSPINGSKGPLVENLFSSLTNLPRKQFWLV